MPPRLRRAALALLLVAQPLGSAPGWAQPLAIKEFAKPLPAEAEPLKASEQADPPARVGRLARLQGRVALRAPGQEDWAAARLNLPVTTGDAFRTGPDARLSLEIGPSRLALDSGSLLEVTRLDDAAFEATLAQGTLFLHLAGLVPEEAVRITTPRGDALIRSPGRYLVAAGTEDMPTRILAYAGAAEVIAEGLEPIALATGQAVLLSGATPPFAEPAPAGPPSPLLAWAEAETPPRPPPAVAGAMTGAADLAAYGQWVVTPDYGDVWLPPVATDWVPYRQGEWRWIEPWGWNWVDDAPWGFAPFHYGRWVRVGPAAAWGWAPAPRGPIAPPLRPVWLPAVVGFVQGAAGHGAPVGWVPLGPREPYVPPFRCSPGYLARVNFAGRGMARPIGLDGFAHHAAATAVPPTAMAHPVPVPIAGLVLPAAALAAAHASPFLPGPRPGTVLPSRFVPSVGPMARPPLPPAFAPPPIVVRPSPARPQPATMPFAGPGKVWSGPPSMPPAGFAVPRPAPPGAMPGSIPLPGRPMPDRPPAAFTPPMPGGRTPLAYRPPPASAPVFRSPPVTMPAAPPVFRPPPPFRPPPASFAPPPSRPSGPPRPFR